MPTHPSAEPGEPSDLPEPADRIDPADPSGPTDQPEPPGLSGPTDSAEPDPPVEAPSYAALGDTVTRALSRGKRRRPARLPALTWPPTVPVGGRRSMFPVAAALGAVLVLSMVWVTTLRDPGAASAYRDGAVEQEAAQHHPSASPREARGQAGPGWSAGERTEAHDSDASGGAACPPPLAVTASPDIAPLVRERAGSWSDSGCAQVTVTAEAPESTLAAMAGGGAAPDVWIPASTLSLRLATSGSGQDLPSSGTSVATSPIMVALPQPVYDAINGPALLPTWRVLYAKLTNDEIPRMSLPDPDSTVGALALLSLLKAMESYDDDAEVFLRTMHFREHLDSLEEDADALLHTLASSSRAQATHQVGVFPATEQALHSFNDRGPRVPAHVMGTYDAVSEADYPAAVARFLDDRRAALATDLIAELRSPAAIDRLVAAGFRPPRSTTTRPAALQDTDRFQDLPDPVALPTAAEWRERRDYWRHF